ncbi:hypothetical protein HMPREF1222_01979 [Treponema vincentii F0403]|uniref:Uncharacterized protein n=1 Tax=Treponema vincentii F0403 TaxID=1125702 RepID=S3LQ57_9SPIR|nr:hypothetical protein [Treponema vincentii]EPF46457.1 hypothetical protein HMPREF1222_01979 [Treponema vincentii F0403]
MTVEALPHSELIIVGVIVLAFILMMKKGGKLSLFGQTVEIPVGGKKQKIDTIGLMYLMKDACERIELLRKERAEDILPDISYLLTGISRLSCCMYRAEAILNKRLYKNGFEDLTTETVSGYIEQLSDELYSHLQRELLHAEQCAVNPPEPIEKSKTYAIAKEFTRRAAAIYLREVKSKAMMYESYQPLFEKLGDTIRVEFCKEKKEKKMKQAEQLLEVLEKLNT